MHDTPVIAIRSVEFGVTDLARASRFYTVAWGLEPVLESPSLVLLCATGVEHHVLRLRSMRQAGLLGIDYAAPSAEAVDRLDRDARASGSVVLAAPHERPARCGGGWGLDLATPDGLRIGVSAGVTVHAGARSDKTRPSRLTHIVVNSADVAAQVAWSIDLLGFRLSDRTRTQEFLRCGPDHHSLAFAHGSGSSLNHAAFEMVDIDGLMYGAGRMLDHGHAVEWGLGRHGPGSNVFSYFVDPDGHAVEYTTEVQQIGDDSAYQPQTPQYWADFPRRPCRWGVARKPSARLIEAFGGRGLAGAGP